MENPVIFVYTLDTVPDWLRNLPQFQPWVEGLVALRHRLSGLVVEFGDQFYDTPALREQAEQDDTLLSRLLTSWLYHWKCSGETSDGEAVLNKLSFYPDSNPLEDVVFAQALEARQTRATVFFLNTHVPALNAQGRKLNGLLYSQAGRDDPHYSDWVGDFLLYLFQPSAEGIPPIRKYQGMVSIRHWFAVVLTNFTLNQQRGKRKKPEYTTTDGVMPLDKRMQDNSISQQMTEQLFQTLVELLQQVINQLHPMDRLRLTYYYRDKLENRHIAKILHEDPSQTSRRRLEIEKCLTATLLQQFRQQDISFWLGDCQKINARTLMQLLFVPQEKKEESND